MPKILLIAALSLVGILALTAALTTNSSRAEPALTRAASLLPITERLFVTPAYARRFIRWDCSDWQPYPAVADADNELASSILETLAANRGKTLYCGLDQSDTWTKRQVYDNAHAHNDRDRTQYDGSQAQGRFRGFTAGQEGWLTDGEHGITGVSPERIFEFPEQKRRRRWKTIIVTESMEVPLETRNCYPLADAAQYPNHNGGYAYAAGCRRALSPWGEYHTFGIQNGLNDRTAATNWPSTARTRYTNNTPSFTWADRAQTAATAYCISQEYERAVDVVATDPALSGIHDWVYERQAAGSGQGRHRAARVNTWSATCEKDTRRRVRGPRR